MQPAYGAPRAAAEQRTPEEIAQPTSKAGRGVLRAVGLGMITGASDDDPSAIGTYATVGAKFGTAMLWLAPPMLPLMVTVVYLSSRLGQVAGKGLFDVIRDHYPRWILRLAADRGADWQHVR